MSSSKEEIEILSDEDEPEIEGKGLKLHESELGTETNTLLPHIRDSLKLSKKEYDNLKKRLWSFSAGLRQPRKDNESCNKTPFFCRWDSNPKTSHLTPADPRYASLQECQKVCATLTALLLEAAQVDSKPPVQAITLAEEILDREFRPESLLCTNTGSAITRTDIKKALSYTTQRLGSYEIPVSYRVELNQGGYHHHTNVGWIKPLHINYKVRQSLRKHLEQAGASNKATKNALDKIQVKAYCTDKNTLPPYFSNRDFRWATWTKSHQYASHYQCALIELELMAQLYELTDAPALDNDLCEEIQSVRGKPLSPSKRLCFVTGIVLNYTDYAEAAKNPKGGKSKYHVGHILPLTRKGRHVRDNIAWVSDDGNRIQGNDTLEEIEAKLIKVVEYHLRRDLMLEQPPESFLSKVESLWALLNEIRAYLGKPQLPW